MSDVSAELAAINVHLSYLKEQMEAVICQLKDLNSRLTDHDFRIKELETHTSKVRMFLKSNWFRLPAFVLACAGGLTWLSEELLTRRLH